MSHSQDLFRLCRSWLLMTALILASGCNEPSGSTPQDPLPDPVDPPTGPGDQPNLPSPFRSVSISMDETHLNHLYSRSVDSDDRLPATVTVDDQGPFSVEMRFRGNSTRHEPKKGFNIRFNDGNQV